MSTIVLPRRNPNAPSLKPPDKISRDGVNLFNKIAEEILHKKREIFDALTPHERSLVLEWLSEALVDGSVENPVHDVLWELDYTRKPVSIETFLNDGEYLGRATSELHPKWKEDLTRVLRPGSTISEWLMTGAIGIGKTTIAMAALAYKIYCLSCLRNPSEYYGLLPNSLIVFGIYSLTKRQVNDAAYFTLRNFIDSSPYFVYTYKRNRKLDSKIQFLEHNVEVIPGSQEFHAIGLNMFSFVMDEVNFMRVKRKTDSEGNVSGQAYDLYKSMKARMRSRFIRAGGSVPGLTMLLSSKNAQTSFLEEHAKTVMRTEPDKVFISDYPLWEVKDASKFKEPKFTVEIGDRVSRSRMLKKGEEPRKGARLIEVPGEFKEPFLKDVDQGLREFAGIATFNLSPLIHDRESIFDAVTASLAHPFTREAITIDVNDPTLIDTYFDIRKCCKVVNSIWTPKINPGVPRFAHVDIGLTGDAAAIAMSHCSGFKTVSKYNVDGTLSTVSAPFVLVDLMLRIIPPPGSQIDISKLRAFVMFLARLYPLNVCTFDGYQSIDSSQILNKQNIESRILSLDREDTQYITLRAAYQERRIMHYAYEPLTDELLDLERDITKRKVDHPMKNAKGGKGSKDVADAVCGSVWHCLTDDRALKLAPPVEMTISALPSGRVIEPVRSNPDAAIPGSMKIVTAPTLPTLPATTRKIDGKAIDWKSLRKNV